MQIWEVDTDETSAIMRVMSFVSRVRRWMMHGHVHTDMWRRVARGDDRHGDEETFRWTRDEDMRDIVYKHVNKN
jgi:hypothetical protein